MTGSPTATLLPAALHLRSSGRVYRWRNSSRPVLVGEEFSIRRIEFFLLDSSPTPSLTLRDYSKVLSRSNCCMRQNPPPKRTVGGAMLSLRCRLSVVCLTVLLCLVPSSLFAQGTTGRILGRVTDPSGAVVAGVKVTLVNEATGINRESTSNASGDYDFVEIPVGTYRLEFDLAGFKKNVRHSVSLDVNQGITLNMTMTLGQNKEVVDVTSEAPLVETSSTQLGAVVDDRTVSTLPLN